MLSRRLHRSQELLEAATALLEQNVNTVEDLFEPGDVNVASAIYLEPRLFISISKRPCQSGILP